MNEKRLSHKAQALDSGIYIPRAEAVGVGPSLGDPVRRFPRLPNDLWDAAILHKALVPVDSGEEDLLKALAAYERAMIDHGFRAVRTSLRDMARFHAENWIERTLTKVVFRAIDLVPGLRHVMVAGR